MITETQAAGAGLLAAILADPADDTPRLIYADWLEENGQAERAEFIRVQCRLANPGVVDRVVSHWFRRASVPAGCHCEPCRLRRREQELLKLPRRCRPFPEASEFSYLNLRSWAAAALAVVPAGAVILDHMVFRRGFLHALTLPGRAWQKYAAAILATQPVQEVTLTTRPTWEIVPYYWHDGQELRRGTAAIFMGDDEWQKFPDDDVSVRRLLARKWPGLTFHLPES